MADLRRAALAALLLAPLFVLLLGAPSAQAAPASRGVPSAVAPRAPARRLPCRRRNPTPTTPSTAPGPRHSGRSNGSGNVSVNLDPGVRQAEPDLSIILALTVLSIAPSVLLLCTSFTKIIVVLALTRNALGLQPSRRTRCSPGSRCS